MSTTKAVVIVSLMVLVPVGIIAGAMAWLIWALKAPDRAARDAAKDSAQHLFHSYKFYVNKAVLAGDLPAVADAIASPDATVLENEVRGSDIELRIAVGDSAHNGGGFNARNASALGCAEMTATLGAEPFWRAVRCPSDVRAFVTLPDPVYTTTLQMSP